MMIQMTSKPYTQESPDTAGVVYIVEDDEAVRDSLKWLLEASSYRVELFESGEMFLAKFDPNAIAVLVLDANFKTVRNSVVNNKLLKNGLNPPNKNCEPNRFRLTKTINRSLFCITVPSRPER